MSDIYKPESLKEDAVQKKLMIDSAVDVQVALQILVQKGICTSEEVQELRKKVKSLPKYRASYQVVENIAEAYEKYATSPEEYLKDLLQAKMDGKVR